MRDRSRRAGGARRPARLPSTQRERPPYRPTTRQIPSPTRPPALSDELVRRAELLMLRQQVRIQDRDARLDRLRSDFDYSQQQRAEFLREMNILRDMAMEQRKKDDELIKKWIALI